MPRFVVIVCDSRPGTLGASAQVVTTDGKRAAIPKYPTWRFVRPGHAEPGDVQSRTTEVVWIFAEGCWPSYAAEIGGFQGNRLYVDPNASDGEPFVRGRVICLPKSRPWDDEVAALAGCGVMRVPGPKGDDTWEVGGWTTSINMVPVPSPFIEAVAAVPDLTPADKRMVYQQLLDLYENTKPERTEIKGELAERFRQAYTKNTALLRQRLADLDTPRSR